MPKGQISEYPIPITEKHKQLIATCGLEVGDRVSTKDVEGTAQYVGPVKYKGAVSQTLYVGILLDDPKGCHSGTLEGIRYFTAPPKQGVFKPISRVSVLESVQISASGNDITQLKHDVSMEAATKEQEAFKMWNAIDKLEESGALLISKDLSMVEREMDRQYGKSMSSRSGDFSFEKKTSFMSVDSLLEEPVYRKYNGPHLKDAPNSEFAQSLIHYYLDNVKDPFPRRYAMSVLVQVESLLRQQVQKAVYHFAMPQKNPDMQLILVGDTHGQLNDVLWLFYKFGVPSPTRTYLFNGDICDRGAYSVEIFLVLFAFKLAHPDSVLINRGNHESPELNEVYGFAQEVRTKYGSTVLQKFQDIFNLLPLCTVIEKRIFVTHGGLFHRDGVKLTELAAVDRQRPCPCSPSTDEELLMFDLMWSDPRHENGRGPSGRGATCISFGPDVTEKFLNDNKLDVCIRSHQVPTSLRGFDPVHEGRCVTLFSASNYCGTSGNYGGVIIFSPSLTFEIQEYMSPGLAEVKDIYNTTKSALLKVLTETQRLQLVSDAEGKAASMSRRSSIYNMEKDVLFKMCCLICENKDAIWSSVWAKDVKKKGVLSSTTLQKCLDASIKARCDEDVPWSLLIDRLKAADELGFVVYSDFLKRFRVEFRPKSGMHVNWRMEAIQQVFEAIMKADLNMKELVMIFDRTSDGKVSYKDFYHLVTELNLGLTEPQVGLLMRIMTAQCLASGNVGPDENVRVDVAEFLGRFKVIYSMAVKDKSGVNAESWIHKALTALGRVILADKVEAAQAYYQRAPGGLLAPPPSERRRSSTLRSAALFEKFMVYGGLDKSGFLSYEAFTAAIRQLPLTKIEQELGFPLTDNRLNELARALDVTGSGKINYLEFLNAFNVANNETTTSVAEEFWQQLCAKFYQQKLSLRCALTRFDPESTGKVTADEFRAALVTLNTVLGSSQAPLTPSQVDLVVNSIDLVDGMVNYLEFIDAFVVVNICQPDSERSVSDIWDNDQGGVSVTDLRASFDSNSSDELQDELHQELMDDSDDVPDPKEQCFNLQSSVEFQYSSLKTK